jgi:hypothetical protein
MLRIRHTGPRGHALGASPLPEFSYQLSPAHGPPGQRRPLQAVPAWQGCPPHEAGPCPLHRVPPARCHLRTGRRMVMSRGSQGTWAAVLLTAVTYFAARHQRSVTSNGMVVVRRPMVRRLADPGPKPSGACVLRCRVTRCRAWVGPRRRSGGSGRPRRRPAGIPDL